MNLLSTIPETKWQAKLLSRLEKVDGVWGCKWATEYANGVPDLVLSHTDLGLFLVEVKRLTGCVEGFDRLVPSRPMQRVVARDVREAGGKVCMMLICEYDGFNYVIAVPSPLNGDERISDIEVKTWGIKWAPKVTDQASFLSTLKRAMY